jgi:NAD+ synthase (glutamine-hydrolysing)
MSSTSPVDSLKLIHSVTAHVGVASVNQTVGDWRGNTARLLKMAEQAQEVGVKLLLFPEMAISGYSLGDRLPRRGTLTRSYLQLKEIAQAPQVRDMVVCVGLPIQHRGVIYNAVAVIAEGRLIGLSAKEHLATGDVEYEDRWYQPWSQGRVEEWIAPDGACCPLGALIFHAEGIGAFAFEICEDAWKGIRPGSMYALEGAELILNPSASWFILGKHATRKNIVLQSSREDHCAYLYASLLGCDNTRLVFDGSLLIAANGELKSEGDRFRFTDGVLSHAIIDLEAIRLARREEGSWRRQVGELSGGRRWSPPHHIELPGDYRTTAPPPPHPPYWVPTEPGPLDPSLEWLHREGLIPHPPTALDLPHLELELALALGLHEYTRKAKIKSIALALSGGRDSAMVALLVHRMFRYRYPHHDPEQLKELVRPAFFTAYLATENSGEETRRAASAVADELGATFFDLNIQAPLDAHRGLIESAMGRELTWSEPVDDIALQNVQARLRGSIIWFLANLHQALLIATSNKSEAAVGYTTMDGDTSGGVSLIADVPKSLVSLWLRWAQRFHGYQSLSLINGLEPTAELRPLGDGQTDEADLMPFEVLDRLLYGFAQLGQDPLALFKSLWPVFSELYRGDALAFSAHIHKFVRLFCFAQWKRERFAVSFRVTSFDLDPKGGGRYPVIQAPFTEELEDLDAYVGALISQE